MLTDPPISASDRTSMTAKAIVQAIRNCVREVEARHRDLPLIPAREVTDAQGNVRRQAEMPAITLEQINERLGADNVQLIEQMKALLNPPAPTPAPAPTETPTQG